MLASNIQDRKHNRIDIESSPQDRIYFISWLKLFEIEYIEICQSIMIILYFFENTIKDFILDLSIVHWAICIFLLVISYLFICSIRISFNIHYIHRK